MLNTLRNEQGTALVAALFFITALSVTATVIVWVTGSERRVSHNQYSHSRSFYSSDAGTETAINWIRTQQMPPAPVEVVASGNPRVKIEDTYTYITGDHKYKIDITHTGIRFRPGWDPKYYVDFDYAIDSFGESSSQSETQIEVRVSRLFRQGY